jgi:hypothetical protein
MALKKYFPDIRFGGNKVDPDEINHRIQYSVMYPAVGTATVWAGLGTGDVAATGTIQNLVMDYPRNLLLTIVGVAGGEGGSATVVGKDQFGASVTETWGFATANAGGTEAGTQIFSLGLPVRIGAASDVKKITFIKNGAVTAINGGTIGTAALTGYVSTVSHSFMGTQILAITDIYNVEVLSTYNSEALGNVA